MADDKLCSFLVVELMHLTFKTCTRIEVRHTARQHAALGCSGGQLQVLLLHTFLDVFRECCQLNLQVLHAAGGNGLGL